MSASHKPESFMDDVSISSAIHTGPHDFNSEGSEHAPEAPPAAAADRAQPATDSPQKTVESPPKYQLPNAVNRRASVPELDPAQSRTDININNRFEPNNTWQASGFYKPYSFDMLKTFLAASIRSLNARVKDPQAWLRIHEGPALLAAARKKLQALADQKNGLPAPQPTPCVDILVPVYGGAAETERCLRSLLASRPTHPHEVIVLNDASPDPQQVAWLQRLADDGVITLLHNPQNLGFVGTANRGMALHPDRDVVLLNSDTEVASDWLDRLIRAAYSSHDIGTVTPFSNNATICSYPRFCQDNHLPSSRSVADLDSLFAQTNAGARVDLPTAVGFCMYIRRACLTETGLFSVEHFGKGYGEENDFCMRATRNGWRHVLAADTFVFHSGGASFSDSSDPRKQHAQKTLATLHPDYPARVHAHIDRDPAGPLRAAVESQRLRSDPRPTLLAITHGLGGGTDKHVEELAQHLAQQANFLILAPQSNDHIEVRWAAEGSGLRLFFRSESDHDALITWLRSVGIDRVHLHHSKSLPRSLWRLPHELGVPFDFTAHDFFSICPQISLTGSQARYCGEPDTDGCRRCLAQQPVPGCSDIETWRRDYQALLAQADRVLCPSQDTAQRLRRYLPAAAIRAVPHPDLDGVRLPVPAPRPTGDRPLRIAVLGQLTAIKGADVLDATARFAHKTGAPLDFHLLGDPYRLLGQAPHSRLQIHGRYRDEDLPRLLAQLAPDVVWFPAQWPETYSYTLSACLRAGLPVVAPDLGAFPERLCGRPYSFVVRWDQSPQDWCRFFVAIRRDHFAVGLPPKPPVLRRPPLAAADFTYSRDYLLPAVAQRQARPSAPAVDARFFVRHAQPPRPPLSRQTLKRLALNQVNRVKSVRLFRQAIEAIPQPLRSRAYRFLAGARA